VARSAPGNSAPPAPDTFSRTPSSARNPDLRRSRRRHGSAHGSSASQKRPLGYGQGAPRPATARVARQPRQRRRLCGVQHRQRDFDVDRCRLRERQD
jgi:hypothetical protein